MKRTQIKSIKTYEVDSIQNSILGNLEYNFDFPKI